MGDDRDEPTQRTGIPRPPARVVAPPPPPTPPPPPPPPADTEARSRIDSLERELAEMRQAIASTQVIRISTPLPSPSSLMPPSSSPESRPSRAAVALQKTKSNGKIVGKITVYLTAAVTLIAQAISFINDPMNGPLVRGLLIMAFSVAGKSPPPDALPEPVWTPLGTRVPPDARTPVPPSIERTEELGQGGQAGHGG
jgi:hypothetical protein